MIFLYSGTPGSGKSLHTADVILHGLQRGRPIICNFDVAHDIKGRKYFTYCPNEKLSPEFLIQYSKDYFKGKRVKEDAILLVIDECQLMFNAREWSASGRNKWLSFFTQHRHFGYTVVLVAQFDRQTDQKPY